MLLIVFQVLFAQQAFPYRWRPVRLVQLNTPFKTIPITSYRRNEPVVCCELCDHPSATLVNMLRFTYDVQKNKHCPNRHIITQLRFKTCTVFGCTFPGMLHEVFVQVLIFWRHICFFVQTLNVISYYRRLCLQDYQKFFDAVEDGKPEAFFKLWAAICTLLYTKPFCL